MLAYYRPPVGSIPDSGTSNVRARAVAIRALPDLCLGITIGASRVHLPWMDVFMHISFKPRHIRGFLYSLWIGGRTKREVAALVSWS